VNVGAEEQAIAQVVRFGFAERLDMGGLEGGERLLPGDRAGATVGIGDQDAKGALADAAAGLREYVAAWKFELTARRDGAGLEASGDLVPQPPADPFGQVVGLAPDGGAGPVPRLRDPVGFWPEEGLDEDDAADREVLIHHSG